MSPTRTRAWPLLLALLLCGATVSCGSGDREPERPDVVLIIVDTLRADRLGSQGNARGLTPVLDAVAASGYRFAEVRAQAPWTLPSTASLFTSTYPQQHGAGGVAIPYVNARGQRVAGYTALNQKLTTLAECFQSAEYETAAFINVDFLGHEFGLTRGFDHVDEHAPENNLEMRNATQTTDAALRWISGRTDKEKPLFLVVHYFDPHAVYAPPPEFRRRFAREDDQKDMRFIFGTRNDMVGIRQGKLQLSSELMQRVAMLYDAEVAYTDQQVGRLLAGLETRGHSDAILAITADHGEEFYEHKGFEHGHSLYDELLHVPLILSWPKHIKSGVNTDLVGLIDVAPTLCQLANIPGGEEFLGRSLVPLMNGAASFPDRPLLAHGNFWGPPLAAMTTGSEKVILVPASSDGAQYRVELYEWRGDRGEQRDLAGAQQKRATLAGTRLREAEQPYHLMRRGAAVELTQAQRDRLIEFGYTGGDVLDVMDIGQRDRKEEE